MTSIAFTVVVAVEVIVFAIVVYLIARVHTEAQEAWIVERRELLNRIQHPEHVPHVPVEGYEIPDREPDGWNQVGTVGEISREWLEGDD